MILLKEDFIRKSTKSTLLTKYKYINCTSHHQLHIQTLHMIQKKVDSMKYLESRNHKDNDEMLR